MHPSRVTISVPAARLEVPVTDSYTSLITASPHPDDELPVDPISVATRRHPRRAGMAAQVLMAAMVGLREGLGFERPTEATIVLAQNLTTGDLPLGFGPLPPLD